MRPLLTRRQSQVCDLVCQGWESKEIATKLGISHRTVATYREEIYDKMKVRNAVELVLKVHHIGEAV